MPGPDRASLPHSTCPVKETALFLPRHVLQHLLGQKIAYILTGHVLATM